MKDFELGQWIEAEEGVGQVISTHDFYVEEYSPDFLSGEKEVGDFLIRICVYKLLSNYKGRVRKSNLVKCSNINYCDPISKEYKVIVDKIMNKNPAEFERFQKFKNKKTLGGEYRIYFRFDNADLDCLKSGIEVINRKLDKPFVFTDFEEAVCSRGLEIDFSKANKNPELRPPDFYISLFNENYAVRNKRALFTKVCGVINDWK